MPKPKLEARLAALEALFVRLAEAGATESILSHGFDRASRSIPNVFYGLYRASVLDNLDPEQRHRLQTHAPSLSSAPLPWAEACAPSTQFSIPSIGDAVWIMFESGNIQYPVWVGVLPGRAA